MADVIENEFLSLQLKGKQGAGLRSNRLLVLGEVLWDIFDESMRLGGAALNFCAHAKRLGYDALLISAVGRDELGDRTAEKMSALGLDTSFLQRTGEFETGTARVQLGPGDLTRFLIQRPAAYDAVRLSKTQLETLRQWRPAWFYYGTLFSSLPQGRAVLDRLLGALPECAKFYDLNLRQGFDSPEPVTSLLALADVVKLNEEELHAVHSFAGLPADMEAFCREGSRRFGWKAACVTLGSRGCAIFSGNDYVEAEGRVIDVADPVGAGDAFAAAFLHGLISNWPVAKIAGFANSVGALVASRHGAIPNWTLKEVTECGTGLSGTHEES